jgi:hypothetical protein
LGKLTVTPPWLAEGMDPASTVVIEPAMAFGTGEHPTTRGVVRLMQAVIRPVIRSPISGPAARCSRSPRSSSARRAPSRSRLDHDSIANAEENVERNGVTDRVAVLEGNAAGMLPLVAPVRIILANIISSVLKEMLPVIAARWRPDGVVILSGILARGAADMMLVGARRAWLGGRGRRGCTKSSGGASGCIARPLAPERPAHARFLAMSLPTFVTDETFTRPSTVTLGEDAAHHMRVRRLETGVRVGLVDGHGTRGEGCAHAARQAACDRERRCGGACGSRAAGAPAAAGG